MSGRDGTKARWWLWRLVTKLPNVCPANAHTRLIWREREQTIKIDGCCRTDFANNRACWCGKLQQP